MARPGLLPNLRRARAARDGAHSRSYTAIEDPPQTSIAASTRLTRRAPAVSRPGRADLSAEAVRLRFHPRFGGPHAPSRRADRVVERISLAMSPPADLPHG